MTNDTQEVTSIGHYLEKVETLSRRERIEQKVFDTLHDWVIAEDGLKHQIQRAHTELARFGNAVPICRTMGEITRALETMKQVVTEDRQIVKLWDDIFTKRGSVVESCKGVPAEEVRNDFAGAISVLTFIDLVSQVDPEYGARIKAVDIMASLHDDVQSKVDLVIDFGTTTKIDGVSHRVIRLVQLKTSSDDQAHVEVIDQERQYGNVSRQDAEAILDMAEQMKDEAREHNEYITVRCYAVEVPSYKSEHVNNPFGIIQRGKKQQPLIAQFTRENQDARLIPIKK